MLTEVIRDFSQLIPAALHTGHGHFLLYLFQVTNLLPLPENDW
jgi:hypothetical protein